jgi:hypothetical protein
MPGQDRVSLIALLFADGVLLASQAETFSGSEVRGWDRAVAGAARLETADPLRRWTASFSTAEAGFDVEATALTEPIDFAGGPAVTVGDFGAGRYEQLCRIRGEATIDGARRELTGVGRRVHEWGTPSPPVGGLLRSLYAVSTEEGLSVAAVRPSASADHGHELVEAYLTVVGDSPPAGGESSPTPFEDARISTVYDAQGAIRKAGLELYRPGDEYPQRASGEARAAAVLEAGGSRIAISFLRWSVQGSPGQGSYQVVSRA